jgi:hypothetical protein
MVSVSELNGCLAKLFKVEEYDIASLYQPAPRQGRPFSGEAKGK